jgi:peptide/nickel transport system substrate-binding protein
MYRSSSSSSYGRESAARRKSSRAVTVCLVLGVLSLGLLSLAACSSSKPGDTAAPGGTETTAPVSDATSGADATTAVESAPADSSAPTTAAAAVTTGADTTVAIGEGNTRELVVARDMDTNSLDPARSYCDTCQIFMTAVYETLMTLDPKDPNVQLPRLATKWEANADNTVFTFTLNPAAKFADGSTVESKDVKWSWERLGNVKGSAAYLMSGVTGIETPDATTVVATFKVPNSAFLPIVAAGYMGIVNSDVATAQGASAAADASTADKAEPWFLKNSAGSGPYALESYTQGDSLVLKRNDAYWGPTKPSFPKVTFKQVKDSSSQLQQLQQGDADIAMQLSIDSLSQLTGNDKVTTSIVDSYNYVYIALSPGAVGAENIKDANVRKALGMAIDYEGAIEALVAGKGKKQASPIPNGFVGSKDLLLPTYDPAKAQELLNAAGKEAGFTLDATYPKVNVYGVDFDLMMQKIQQDLKKIKVELKLTPVEFPQWADKMSKQGIPVTAVYFAPDHSDSSQYVQYFGEVEGSSWAGRAAGGDKAKPLINPKETELLAQALAASGDAKTKAYTNLGQAMIDDAVIFPIVNPQLVLAYASDITGMHYSACCNLDLALLGIKR